MGPKKQEEQGQGLVQQFNFKIQGETVETWFAVKKYFLGRNEDPSNVEIFRRLIHFFYQENIATTKQNKDDSV
ncbi:MAG: hypothetical protein ACE5OZ_20040 [Candidatus Heimdallarchaeota archaeon]